MRRNVGILGPMRGVVLMLAMVLFGLVCGDPPGGPLVAIDTPLVEPVPYHQVVGVSISPVLIWSRIDGRDLTEHYELYLDTVIPPKLYVSKLTDTVFRPGVLEPERTYYWRVVTKGSGHVFEMSPLWNFTTGTGIFPLAIGNRWDYDVSYWNENIQPLSLRSKYSDTLLRQVEIGIDDYITGSDNSGLYRFRSTYLHQNRLAEGYHYYRESRDGLYLVGVESPGGGGVFPKLGRGVSYNFAGRTFNSIEELWTLLELNPPGLMGAGSDDLYPQKCYQYPLRVGDQWTYLEQDSGMLNIDRQVIDWQSIDIPLGRFQCFVIRHLYDLAGDGIWDENIEVVDYVAPEGLVRRTQIIHGVMIQDWGNGGPMGSGTGDFVSDAILTDVKFGHQ